MKKLVALLFVSLLTTVGFSQTYTITDNYNNTVVGCSGTVVDNGGAGGNYSNNVEGVLTICSGTPGVGVVLDFTQFALENNWDYMYIYDGPSNNGYPLLNTLTGNTNPGQIISSQECITIEFDTDGSVTSGGFQINISCGTIPTCFDGIQNQGEGGIDCGGCFCPSCPTGPGAGSSATVTADADVYVLPCGGGPVNLSAIGIDYVPVLSSDFNNGTPGPGWETTPGGAQYDNPCGGGPNGSHLWFGAGTAAPRELITAPLDLRCGGEICFYLKMEPEASGDVSPCEGSDEYDEGVSVQWSNADCSGWNDFMYFAPVGDLLTSYPGNGVNSPGATGQTAFTTWQEYCAQVPPGAWTPATQIRWYQWGSSGTGFDHWGLDEVTINADACLPYFYDWEHVPGFPDSPNSFVNPTQTTTYTVHYTNGVDDTVTAQVTIVVEGVETPGVAVTEEVCLGDNDAQATITAVGGTANYSVNLVGPSGYNTTQSTAGSTTFTGLAPGLYTVTITDNGGCTSDTTFTINPGPTCCTTTAAGTDLTCNQNNQACDGQGTANPSGGVTPYSYQWYTGSGTGAPIAGQTGQNISGICPGTYTVQITDATGCQADAEITITEPTEVVITLVGTDPLCNGGTDGSITASTTGGSPTYQYSLDGVNYAGVNSTNVGAGTYTVYTQDINGCVDSDNITINEPPAILPAIDATQNSTCGQSNGTFDVSASGGTGTLTFTQGATSNTTGAFTGYAAGTYTVTVTDANNCTTTIDVTIGDDAGPVAVLDNFQDALCFGVPDGSATVTATGGTPAITYSVDGGAFGATNTFTGLTAGNHTLTVQDANGCTDQVTVTISQPTQLAFSAVVTDVQCNGDCDGEIDITASGGVAPYEYSTDFGVSYTPTNPVTGLCAGNQMIVVRDANGCTVNQNFVIAEPTPLTATFPTTDATCDGAADGTITVNASGGTATYQYAIGGGALQASNSFTGLAAGTYTIDVVDANGCIFQQNVTINEPAPMVLTLDLNQNSTCGSANGEINVSATGGDGNYTFTIDGGSPNGTGIFTGLVAGTYAIAVSDGNGCTDNFNVTVVDQGSPVVAGTVTDVICNGGSTGSVLVNVTSGGTPAFQYSDDNITFGGTNNFTGLTAGNYTFYVQDANGCSASVNVTVNEPAAPVVTFTPSDNSCFNACDGEVDVTVVSGGTAPFQYSSNGGVTWQAASPITGLCAGTYDVQVQDALGCILGTSNETIAQPVVLGATFAPVNVTCNGGTDGSITVNATGGTTAYQYSINGGALQASNSFTGLAAGTYSVQVVDANGCTFQQNVTITQPTAVQIILDLNANSACGQATGEINVSAIGGDGTYTYTINGGSPNATGIFTGLAAGAYTMTATDGAGCPNDMVVNVVDDSAPTLSATPTDVTCNGGADGEVLLSVTGGVPAYTYSDDNITFGAANNFTGLSAGTYTFYVEDANGCAHQVNATINEPAAPVVTFTPSDNTCFDACDGQVVVNVVSGGVAPYEYSSNGGTTWQAGSTLAGLCDGTYDVQVRDASGCVLVTSTEVIAEPSEIIPNPTAVIATCGLNNGEVTLAASGGVGPYTYDWQVTGVFNGTTNYTGLAPATYNFEVQDATGCIVAGTIGIGSASAPTIDNSSFVGLDCNGDTDGTITVDASGGIGTIDYNINGGAFNPIGAAPGPVSNTFTGLGAGTYTIGVQDDNGCVVFTTVTITNPPLLTYNTTITDILCNGDATGVINVVANGGTGTINYSLNGAAPVTTSSFTGLTAGTYTMDVTDANGCTVSTNETITEPTLLDITGVTGTDALCFGVSNGTIDITAVGGTAPISYSVDNGASIQAASSFTGLPAGTYTVYVEDDNGCTHTDTYTINEPTQLTFVAPTTNSTCSQNDGTITVTANGGTTPYNYSYDGGATYSTNATYNDFAGNYTVYVEDDNGCQDSMVVTISNDNAATIDNIATTPPLCVGSADGTITITATGLAPLTYGINGGAPQASNVFTIGAGTHTIEVYDANNCLTAGTATLVDPAPLSYSSNLTNLLCNGDGSGVIQLAAAGGTGAGTYNYSLNGGATNTTGNFTGLAAGTYTVDITDGNGCPLTSSETITEPTVLVIDNVTGTDALCFGATNGTITITASGGTAPLTYSVDNGVSIQNNGAFTGLGQGAYSIVVEDANGCQQTSNFTVNEPADLTFTAPTTNSTCSQNDGTITVNVAGGTANFNYSFDGGTTFGAGNVYTDFAGTYDIVVEDANGCQEAAQITIIDEPAAIIDNIAVTDPLCTGAADGTITITATGTAALTYGINGGAAQASNVFNVGAGAYTIEVYDGNNCLTTGNATLVDPAPLTILVNTQDILCNGDATGSIQIVSTGGTGALSYSIDNGATFNTPTNNFNFGSLTAGNYTAYVEDANGCTITSPVVLNEPTLLQATYATVDATCFDLCDGMIVINATGGTTPYTYSPNGTVFGTNDTIFDLCDGNYNVTVTDDNGCTINSAEVINEPTLVTLTLATTNETCDAVNGVITATGGGGTAPLTYFLDGGAGQASNIFNGVDNGNHNVVVEDGNGCQATANVNVIADPIPLINTVALTNPLCNGSADGTATVSTTGGVGTILYSVDGGATQTSNLFNTLTSGLHIIEIIDDNMCTDTVHVTLVDPTPLVIDNITTTDVDCNGNTTGGFQVTASGGTPAYTYSFDGGTTFQGSASNNFIAAGNYDVVVEDANGCQVGPQTVTINEPAVLAWNPQITVTDASCYGVCDGVIDAPVTGGTAPFSYNWSGAIAGSTDTQATGVCAGTYGVIVTDDNGCQIQDLAVIVGEPPLLTINSAVADSVSCNGDADGVITIDAPLGISFTIDNGTNTITNATGLFDGDPATGTDPNMLPVGLYNITVTDAFGCSATTNVTIYEPDPLVLNLGVDITICTNIPITVSGSVTGGTLGYNYQWGGSGTGTQQSITVSQMQDETYTLTVTDQNGCTATDDKTLFVIDPMVLAPLADDTICPGDQVTLNASASLGDSPYFFTWSVDNFLDTVSSVTFTPTQQTTVVTLRAKDNCGTEDSTQATIYWYSYPSFDIFGATDGCVEHTVNLVNSMAGFTGGNCLWNFGDGNSSTACDSVTHTYTDPGTYDVSLSFTTTDGCTVDSTFAQLINVYAIPEANFTWSPTDATIMDPTVNFTNLSVDADSYAWNFAGYGSSTEENPTFTFPTDSARLYNTCLTAFAVYPTVTCIDNFCAEVKIKEDFLIYVPNAFTPDGDPFNQTFKPVLTGIDIYDYELLIFDRWGELIFESHNKEVGWDGYYQGKLVQDGVYVWKINLKIEDVDDRKTYYGHVTLLR